MISTDYPICLTRTCGHACVVNTMALHLAGITGNTPQVEGGLYELDESGEPNGVFRENAMDLIYGCLPEPAKEDIKEMILAASKALNRYGVTSSQTDDLLAFNNVPYERVLEAYRELDAEGRMFEEEVKGRIAPGMLADFVILGANPFETSPEELAGIPVEATYVDGVCRYSREAEGKQQQEKQKKGFYFLVKCYILFNSTGIPVQNWKVLYQGNPGGIPC